MSLHFSQKKNRGKCFSCGWTCDSISLVEKVKGVGFLDACKWLAEEYNLIISGLHFEERETAMKERISEVDVGYLESLMARPRITSLARRFLVEGRSSICRKRRLSVGFFPLSSPSDFSIFETSSAAAARVKVTTRSLETSTLFEHTLSVIRLVSTAVFPLPAAALTAIDIPSALIACACAGVHLISGITNFPSPIFLHIILYIFLMSVSTRKTNAKTPRGRDLQMRKRLQASPRREGFAGLRSNRGRPRREEEDHCILYR